MFFMYKSFSAYTVLVGVQVTNNYLSKNKVRYLKLVTCKQYLITPIIQTYNGI